MGRRNLQKLLFVWVVVSQVLAGQDGAARLHSWNRQLEQARPEVWVERAKLLTDLMRYDPGAALDGAISAAEVARLRRLRPETSQWLEEWSEWEGEAEPIVHDDFAAGSHRYILLLRTPEGTREVHFSEPTPVLRCGDRIRVQGFRLGGEIAGRMVGPVAQNRNLASCSTVGDQKVAILLLQFPSTPLPGSVTAAGFQANLTGVTNSVDGYWREASYGLTSASGSVFGPFTLARSYSCTEVDAIRNAAIAVADSTVNFTQYSRVILVFPGACGGLGDLGCGTHVSPSRGSFTASFAWLGTDFASNSGLATCGMIHELGHGMGLHHASTVSYGTLPLGGISAAGTHDEYGDRFSLMGLCYSLNGSYLMGHYAGPHKKTLGWLSGSSFQEVESSGTFTLAPYEESGAAAKVLRVRRGLGNDRWLWIEYRRPTGYDATLAPFSTQVFTGALVHYEDPSAYTGYTRLANFRAATNPNSFTGPSLASGQTWSDPYTELRLDVLSASSSGMTIQVSYDTPCAALTPASQTHGSAGTSGSVTVTAPGSCGWSATSNNSWITVENGASGLGNGTVSYSVSGNTTASTRSGGISIGRQTFAITQNSTNSAPIINSLNPSSGTVSVSANQTFTAVVTDADGASSLNTVGIWFNSGTSKSNTCYVEYRRSSGILGLYDDAGVGYTYSAISASTSLANSQCQINVGQSSAAISGNALTLQVSVRFLSAFVGTRSIQGYATDSPGATSGNQLLGSITVASGTAITLNTIPAGLQVLVDGSPYIGPTVLNATPGSTLSLDLVSPQSAGSSRSLFANWSDGGAKAHSITVGATPATYTATFTVQHAVVTAASPPVGGTLAVSPTSTDGYYTQGTAAQFTATPAAGYVFSNFSGGIGGSANPQSASLGAPLTVTANFACNYSLSTANGTAGPASGSGNLTVTTGGGCVFTAVSGASWLTVTPANATGTTVITYAFPANSAPANRTAAITIAGQSFTLTQAGVSPIPLVVSATPTSTTASPQTFTITTRDSNGAENINRVYFLVNGNSTVPANSCHGFFERASNAFFLYNDGLTALTGPLTPGSGGTLSNNQCTIHGTSSAVVSASGTDVVINLAISRAGSFAITSQNFYVFVTDMEGNGSGWVQTGVWGATASGPQVISGTPASATAPTQTFTFTTRDANSDIDRIYFVVNPTASVPINSCHGYYSRYANALFLYNNDLTVAQGPLTPGASGTLSNNQCGINGSSSALVSASGTDVVLNLGLSFAGSYGDTAKNIYLWVTDLSGLGTGWVQTGSWSTGATAAQAPTVVSGTPSSSTNASQTFTFTVRDANGVGNLTRIYFLINNSANVPVNSCHGYYDRAANRVTLYKDTLTGVLGSLVPGAAGTLSNSQCVINGSATAVTTPTGTDLVLSLALGLLGSYAASPQNVYIWVTDAEGTGSGWVQTSTWNGPSGTPVAPTVVSATPTGPTGSPQTFTYTVRDGNGATNIDRIYFVVNGTASVPVNSCHGFYSRSVNALYLYNDALSVLQGPLTPGGAGTISNAQCTIDGASSSLISAAGTDVVLRLGLSLSSGYGSTAQNMYLWVTDIAALGTGWIQTATWNSGGSAQSPTVAAFSPSSSSVTTQTLTVTARDGNGYADIQRVYFLVNSSASVPAGSCHGFYDRASNAVFLYNDALTALSGPLTPGSGGTIQNSQCVVNGATSSVTASGTDVILSLNVTRTGSAVSGQRYYYTWVTDNAGAGTGWVQGTSWTL